MHKDTFYARPAEVVAPELLGAVISHGVRRARIVEVEAYGGEGEDPASHAHRGLTPRTASMFGPPGRLYVYLSYGVHWCANVVTGNDGEGSAVLLRAAEVAGGADVIRVSRPTARTDAELLRGPGNLARGLGLTRDHDGMDLTGAEKSLWLEEVGGEAGDIVVTSRIGISRATDRLWRWFLEGSPAVSGRRAS